ncbi:MAG: hypothetical protein LBB84_03350 [Tannerellaceae bacterium]|nr:hypothetical protein [Tannerellaceae bacterium]
MTNPKTTNGFGVNRLKNPKTTNGFGVNRLKNSKTTNGFGENRLTNSKTIGSTAPALFPKYRNTLLHRLRQAKNLAQKLVQKVFFSI